MIGNAMESSTTSKMPKRPLSRFGVFSFDCSSMMNIPLDLLYTASCSLFLLGWLEERKETRCFRRLGL
jgi:hypothetical protein